jgi:23S rRNA (uracil1939-C5)-methyltransferase
MNPNKIRIATIKKIINGGYGLSSAEDGKTILVRHCLPGETVEIRIVEQQQHVDYGITVDIPVPHSNRIIPPCPWYTSCGGCDLQHADYLTQCSIKDDILKDLFERNQPGSLGELIPLVAPILPSPGEFGYRQRIRLKAGKNTIGFKRFRSHEIVPIKRCLLAPDNINSALEILPYASGFHSLSSITEEIDILSNPDDATLCLVFSIKRKPRPNDRKSARQLADEIGPGTRIFLAGRQFSIEGPFSGRKEETDRYLSMTFPGQDPLTLSWEAGGFCQVNIRQNFNLVTLVLDFCEPSSSDKLLDLYCGMGNFALPLSQMTGQVYGIESQGSAIRSGRHNSDYNQRSNITFQKSEVMTACKTLAESNELFDTIVCDPPRQGMPNMASFLGRLCKRRVVYISCDPATLCRDLASLQQQGFTVKKIQPVDMFPQTHHIETITLLEKK